MNDRLKRRILTSNDSGSRLNSVTAWLGSFAPDAEMILIGASGESADEAARQAVGKTGARFGLHRFTLNRLASRIAAPRIAALGRTPASSLTMAALAARATHLLLERDLLSYFKPVASTPGFPVAAARTIEEIRMNRVDLDLLKAVEPAGRDLARLADRINFEMSAAGIADRAEIFQTAIQAVRSSTPFEYAGRPLLLIDLSVNTVLEAEFLAAIASHASEVLAVAPTGDQMSIANLARALGCRPEEISDGAGQDSSNSLARLKTHLFASVSPEQRPLDDTMRVTSAPGEARECVEIARQIQSEAERGVPFDRMAVFVRSTEQYRSHLQEAFHRAKIPTYFARGTTRPDPAGRALLALLACKVEKLSARRFAEYLSLSQVPDIGALPAGAGGADAARTAWKWTGPRHDLLPVDLAGSPVAEAGDDGEPQAPTRETPKGDRRSNGDGPSRAPWRWERLLVDAAVIGSRDRWVRRLDGLKKEIEKRREELDDPQDAHAAALEGQLSDLDHLRDYAMPLIDRLAAMPDTANWGEWLNELRELTAAAIRDNERILETLAELEPMSPIGPIDIDELLLVLTPRLGELSIPAKRRRYGAVFVGPAEAARGMTFDTVFIPGLGERLFPRKIAEDPILLDEARARLGSAGLLKQNDRLDAERLLLRLAVGAAAHRVYLSYPRIDMEQSRARVPSLYTLEAFRAAEGTLPNLDRLEEQARSGPRVRLGWPAPERPEDAIDEAEYDLALLSPLVTAGAASGPRNPVSAAETGFAAGAANYLLTANPHLARSLRRRARRWLRRWTTEDGLVDPDQLARDALAGHQLSARSYSPTGLQHYSLCPYQFFLQAVLRLQPREEKVPLETIDPLTRGALFHDAQYEILTRLKHEGLLPLSPDKVSEAVAIADEIAVRVSNDYRDDLFPAIPRVWEDGMNIIRADLREWLRRSAVSTDGWIPHMFELSFGLKDRDRPHQDPASVDDAVEVAGGLKVRGSIDLVERRRDGTLRVTDHKTGRPHAKADVVIGGGQVLQPVLYSLVCEKMLGKTVQAGRLYYCTSAGGYSDRVVDFDNESRAAAAKVIETISQALQDGFLPAAPEKGACNRCDYRLACGPGEETRASIQKRKGGIKPADRVKTLLELRETP